MTDRNRQNAPARRAGPTAEQPAARGAPPAAAADLAGSAGSANSAAADELQELHGSIERVTFVSEETGFTVARVRQKGDRDTVTVVGPMIDPIPGQIIKAVGRWRMDPKWGRQFKAEQCEAQLPASAAGIRLYLQSGLVKGIGREYAERIVDRFQERTIDILDNEPDRLLEVEGIGKKRLEKLKAAWEEQRQGHDLMLFLQSHGVGVTYAMRIFKHYGEMALDVVRENPYRLARDIHGIGFLTADAIAQKLGFAKDCDLRAEAGLLFSLWKQADNGHVFLPRDQLFHEAAELLEIPAEGLSGPLETLRAEEHVVFDQVDGVEAVYPKALFICEHAAAKRLRLLLAAPKSLRPLNADRGLAEAERSLGLSLAPGQRQAVRQAMQSKVLVITGGPGTGKTTILRAILEIFLASKAKAALAAPTGRAAKRLSEATGHEAKTVHRLLEFGQQSGFGRNEDHPLNCHLLVVDEASMMDAMLLHHLLKAVPPGATLLLVGDVNQLPSVGPGNVLSDIIHSGVVPVVELTEIFRQARESEIILGAHAINQGRYPRLKPPEDRLSDFYFINQEDPAIVANLVVGMVKERIPARFGLNPIEDVQVLAPMHKGSAGAENLNLMLQDALNPGQPEITRGGRRFRLRDKVMQTRNNYEKEVFNGDLGRIVALEPENRRMAVRFDDRVLDYDFGDLDELIPAYAVSVHKSQGSEYPAVVVPLVTQHYIMLQRNLVYTAVTRGRKLVVLVGSVKALGIALRNNSGLTRNTGLAQRLARG